MPLNVITHKGKRIISVDFTDLKPDECLELIAVARARVSAEPPRSVLLLTDVTNAHYNGEVITAYKEYAKNNNTYVKASAAVGVDGLRAAIFRVVLFISGRDIKLFKTREEAKDYLVAHD